MSLRDRVRRMLADVTRETPRPQPPPSPAPSPLRIAAFGTLLALSERLKKTDRAGLASVDALKEARWSGREIARAVKALLEGEPEGTRGASWQRASALLMARAFAAPPEDAAPCEHATEVRSVAGRIGWSVPLGHACTKVRVAAGETVRRGEAAFARESAEGLRAKEMADHRAWLRDNADSVTVPEHPAVALLREIEWNGSPSTRVAVCPCCEVQVPLAEGPCDEPEDEAKAAMQANHLQGCKLAAILAGSKAGERALSEVLAEERELGRREATLVATRKAAEVFRATHDEVARKLAEARAAGRAEEREAICTWLSAEWGTQERTETNDLIGEVVQNIRDGQHRDRGHHGATVQSEREDRKDVQRAFEKARTFLHHLGMLGAFEAWCDGVEPNPRPVKLQLEEAAKGERAATLERAAAARASWDAAFQAGEAHATREEREACAAILVAHRQRCATDGERELLDDAEEAIRARGQR